MTRCNRFDLLWALFYRTTTIIIQLIQLVCIFKRDWRTLVRKERRVNERMGQALLVERVRVTDQREGTVVWTRPWSSELKDWISLLMKDCVKEWTWGVKTDWMLFMISEETARRKEPKVNDWEWSELLLCKEERTNGVTEGEIHLKESELPNEQMDWRLKHNLCVFIWRTEGAIPLGSWNEVKRSDCSWMRPHTKIHSVWSNELSERNK